MPYYTRLEGTNRFLAVPSKMSVGKPRYGHVADRNPGNIGSAPGHAVDKLKKGGVLMPRLKYWTAGALVVLVLSAGCGATALGPNAHKPGNKTTTGMRHGTVHKRAVKTKRGLKTAAERGKRAGTKAVKHGKRTVKKAGRKAIRFARRTKHKVNPAQKRPRGKLPVRNDQRVKKHATKIRNSAQSPARVGAAVSTGDPMTFASSPREVVRTMCAPARAMTVSKTGLAPLAARYTQIL